MRRLLFLFFLSILFSCSQPKSEPVVGHRVDTLCVVVIEQSGQKKIDSLLIKIDRLQFQSDSIENYADSLIQKMFLAEYKLSKVDYYLKLCLVDNTQTKFLKGWIRRALQ